MKYVIATISLVFWCSSVSAGSTMPIGIPSPPFGLEETVLSIHGDADYYTHWIDNTAGNCSDSGNGTPSVPRCTIPTVSGLAAGSVVQLRGGPYTGSILTVGGIGTAIKPIFFRGNSPLKKVLFSRHLRIRNAAYLIVENIDFTAVSSDAMIDLRTGSDSDSLSYISIRYNEATGTGSPTAGSAFSGGGSAYAFPSHDIVYYNNKVHDFGDWKSATENDTHCLGVGRDHYNSWYLNNELYHCSGDGIGNGHDANHKTYNLYIDGNTIYSNRENAVDLKEVHNVIISNNTMHGYTSTNSSAGEAVVIHYGPTTGEGPYNTWTINNTIYDSVRGYAGSDVEAGNYIIGNVFYNISGAAIDVNNTGGGGYYAYHNTIVNCGTGLNWGVNTDALSFGGNIVSNSSAYHMRVDTTTQADTITSVNKELYWQNGNPVNIGWKTATYSSVEAWQAASGKGSGSLQSDPLFIDSAGHNYRLQVGSPAINSGVDMSAINVTFQSTFGTAVSLLKDAAGTPRPDGVWDIGAYEYRAGKIRYTLGGKVARPYDN